MELLLGAAFTIDSPSPAQDLFFSQDNDATLRRIDSDDEDGDGHHSTTSSSSIGVPDDASEDEDGATSSSPFVASLEDSLPGKRGLSNFFSGKSKSFANLSEVAGNVKEIEKEEKPFNKRRRLLLANRRASATKRLSFCAWRNPNSMPSLPQDEDVTEENRLRRLMRTRSHLLPPAGPPCDKAVDSEQGSSRWSSQSCSFLLDLQ